MAQRVTTADDTARAQFPKKLKFLWVPARYKVIKGGRGALKSWTVARTLLVLGTQRPINVLCAREIQKSIKDSVHRLLSKQIDKLGFGGFYRILDKEIVGLNGTLFTFHGLRHNVDNIKSIEDTDIAWIEEAQTVSKHSWDTLVPTIRKAGSEIWVTFNPELEDDETYKRFVLKPPTGAVVVHTTYRDNRWLTDELRQEMEDCRARSEDDYQHIWEGQCRTVLEGAIYAEELRKAKLESRVTDVPYDPTRPVHTFWDLGWNSVTGRTAVTMTQIVNANYRVIDYHEDAQHTVQWHISELQKRGYVWGTDWLPHDADSTNLPAGGRTVAGIMRGLGRTVRVLPRRPVDEGHMAVRTIFGQCWFDQTRTADLLQCLNRYRYEVDPESGLRSRKPEESVFKHGADSFRTMGMAISEEKKPKKKGETEQRRNYQGPGSWMGM